MGLKNLSKGILALILMFTLMGASCEKKNLRYMLERMPSEYRKCAEEVVAIPDGPLTQRDLLRLTIELRKYGNRQNRCLRGAIAWADAQWDVYNQFYQQR